MYEWMLRVQSAKKPNSPVKAEVVLIDPKSMTVSWMNESAAEALANRGIEAVAGASIDQVLPMAEALGVPAALRAVAETGAAQHLRTDLISTARGSMGMVMSIYRLPDAKLLVLMENAWRSEQTKTGRISRRIR